jgi:hypothetical protein
MRVRQSVQYHERMALATASSTPAQRTWNERKHGPSQHSRVEPTSSLSSSSPAPAAEAEAEAAEEEDEDLESGLGGRTPSQYVQNGSFCYTHTYIKQQRMSYKHSF